MGSLAKVIYIFNDVQNSKYVNNMLFNVLDYG